MAKLSESDVESILSGPLLTFTNACYLTIIGIEATAYYYDNLPISLQVLSIAICCIIVGSYNSVSNQASPTQEVETMTAKDAYMFPIIGSCVLCSAYFLINYLPAFVLDSAIRLLFFTIATFSSQSFVMQLSQHFIPKMIFESILNIHLINILIKWKEFKFSTQIITEISIEFFYPISVSFPSTLPQTENNTTDSASNDNTNNNNNSNNTSKDETNTNNNNKTNNIEETGIACRIIDLLTLLIGAIVSVIWFTTQHWLSNNIIGIATSIHAIAFLNPGSYYTAAVLLSLLFFYDIFWVFGTDVMVTVAKNINAPIKLIFPRPAVMEKPSMLGLGDIVLPGIYIALLLRYDIWKFIESTKQNKRSNSTNNGTNDGSNKSRSSDSYDNISYSTWIICLVCYVVALGNCLFIMYYFEHAQPALLYLVPGCILPILALAYFRGDLPMLWKYDEGEDSEASNKKTQ